MHPIRLLLGFGLFLLGLAYLFRPGLVLRFNAFMRDALFRDSHVLLYNRRIGLVIVMAALLILLTGLRRMP